MDPHIDIDESQPGHVYSDCVKRAFADALAERGKLDAGVLAMEGMSGRKYRLFINNLVALIANSRYLEVGVWKGSTLCAAIHGNRVRALAVDNWSEFDGPAREFFANLGRFAGDPAAVSFLDSDFRSVPFAALGRFNIYLFDGPHGVEDHRDGIVLPQPALDEEFVLIIDDWNDPEVRKGTRQGLREAAIRVDLRIELRTTLDDTYPTDEHCEESAWHNGYFFAACSKRS